MKEGLIGIEISTTPCLIEFHMSVLDRERGYKNARKVRGTKYTTTTFTVV